MNALDPVLRSLELTAETGEDITRRVHETFVAGNPQAAGLMDHMDEHMLGRMMAEVLTVLMAEDIESQRDYLNFEVGSHRAYGVLESMYRGLLVAVRDAVRTVLGPDWNDDFATAWDARLAVVMSEIRRADPAGEAG